MMDQKEVAEDERERADLLMNGASELQRQPSIHEQRMLSGKVGYLVETHLSTHN